MEGMSYVLSFTFFGAAYFHLALVALAFLILSPPLQKMGLLLCFYSLALGSVVLFRVELRWPGPGCIKPALKCSLR